MEAKLGDFVTAKLLGKNDCRQGVIIDKSPLRIRCVSGIEHECEGEPTIAINPPEICIGCDLPLGRFCIRCAKNLSALIEAVEDNFIIIST